MVGSTAKLPWHRRLMIIGSVIAWLFWIVGQIFRDQSWVLALMFYIPSPALMAVLLVFTAISRRRRFTEWRLFAVMALLPLFVMLIIENRWWPSQPHVNSVGSTRLVHWNICRTRMGWQSQKDALFSLNPEIIVLSEVTDEVKEDDFEGFEVLKRSGLLIACRGKISLTGFVSVPSKLTVFHTRCELPGGPLTVMVADHVSCVDVWRDPNLRIMFQVMSGGNVDVLAGDLNAPRLSRAFCDLPDGYRHAYDVAGSGYSYTWPVPVPFLAIDQCLCGPQVQPVAYRLQSTMLSDHRIQILDFVRR